MNICPGYSGETCDQPVEYRQALANDPASYCRRHALMAAAWWDSLGFSGTSYQRLSDGQWFKSGPAQSADAIDPHAEGRER